MKIYGKEVNVDDLFDESYMHQKINNDIYLNKYQIEILNKYKINYKACSSVKGLLFLIEDIVTNEDDVEDLEILSKELSEFDYYHNTNK